MTESYHEAIQRSETSYADRALHAPILSHARAIERQRSKVYGLSGLMSIDPAESFTLRRAVLHLDRALAMPNVSDYEREWVMAADYKVLRVLNHTKSREKAMDDLVDAYNYCALVYDWWAREGLLAKRHLQAEMVLEAYRCCASVFARWAAAGTAPRTAEELA